MKLTKGKIRKAINKKKQTMKRYKKSNINNGNNSKKTNYKSKTFRKKRSTNLLKSTLKNYGMLGGAEGEFYKLKEGAENDGKLENYEPVDSRENETGNIIPIEESSSINEIQPLTNETDVKVDSEAESQPQADINLKSQDDPNANVGPEVELDPQAKVELDPQAEVDPQADTDPQAEVDLNDLPEADNNTEVEVDPNINPEVDLNDLPEAEEVSSIPYSAENIQPVSSNDYKKEEVIKALEVLTNYILEKNYERTGAVGTVQGMTETFDKELSK